MLYTEYTIVNIVVAFDARQRAAVACECLLPRGVRDERGRARRRCRILILDEYVAGHMGPAPLSLNFEAASDWATYMGASGD